MSQKSKPLPTLTRRRLTGRLREMMPDFPAELLSAAGQIILSSMSQALSEGRPITLRGFGTFQVRRYKDSTKKVGLIFRASPELARRINKEGRPASPMPPARKAKPAVKAEPGAKTAPAAKAAPAPSKARGGKKAARPKSNQGLLFPLWDDENE